MNENLTSFNSGKNPKNQRNIRLKSTSPSMLVLGLAGCGGGDSGATISSTRDTSSDPSSTNISGNDLRSVGLTGDRIIDASNYGMAWNNSKSNIINYAIANGYSGETWSNPSQALTNLHYVMSQLEYYTPLKAQYKGYFSNPTTAENNGSLITLSIDGDETIAEAYAYILIDENDPVDRGDVYFSSKSQENLSNAYSGSLAAYILLHEIGHALGLKHPQDSTFSNPSYYQSFIGQFDQSIYTVMSYNASANSYEYSFDPSSFMIFDVYTLQHLYGANPSTNAGDTTYHLSSTIYQTLYDASGIDTIDLSNFSSGATVYMGDLTISGSNISAGYVASWDSGLNLGPTTIHWLVGGFENIIGSNYSDTIFTNSLVNSINTGNGNDLVISDAGGMDTIITGAGFDTIHVYTKGQDVKIVDFVEGQDKFLIFDSVGNYLGQDDYTISRMTGETIIITNNTEITFEDIQLSEELYVADEDDPLNEFVYFNASKMTFELTVSGFNFFDRIHSDIMSGSYNLKYAIRYEDIETEDPRYVSPGYSGINWIDADFIAATERDGKKSIVVQDILLKDIDLGNSAQHIGFYIATDNYWVGEDFTLSAFSVIA